MKKTKVFKLTFCAIMASVSIILTLFEVNLPIFNVALYGLPLVLTSILFGPSYGFTAGLVAGLVEQITKGLSIQSFIWILAPLSWGGLSGLVYHGLKKIFNDNKNYKKIIYITISVLIAIFFANLCNSAAMAIFAYTKDPITSVGTFIAYAISRMVSIPIHVIVYVPLCYLSCTKLNNYLTEVDQNI